MDGRGRWMDNVFIERRWRSVKYEEVCLSSYDSIKEARRGLGAYFEFYNHLRRHQSLEKRTPNEVYWASVTPAAAGVWPSRLSPKKRVSLSKETRPPL